MGLSWHGLAPNLMIPLSLVYLCLGESLSQGWEDVGGWCFTFEPGAAPLNKNLAIGYVELNLVDAYQENHSSRWFSRVSLCHGILIYIAICWRFSSCLSDLFTNTPGWKETTARNEQLVLAWIRYTLHVWQYEVYYVILQFRSKPA